MLSYSLIALIGIAVQVTAPPPPCESRCMTVYCPPIPCERQYHYTPECACCPICSPVRSVGAVCSADGRCGTCMPGLYCYEPFPTWPGDTACYWTCRPNLFPTPPTTTPGLDIPEPQE